MMLVECVFEAWQISWPQQLDGIGVGLFLAHKFGVVSRIIAPGRISAIQSNNIRTDLPVVCFHEVLFLLVVSVVR
jgi:hypothetical protein